MWYTILFLVGALTGAITTPLDVIKTRLMVQVRICNPVSFSFLYILFLPDIPLSSYTYDTFCVWLICKQATKRIYSVNYLAIHEVSIFLLLRVLQTNIRELRIAFKPLLRKRDLVPFWRYVFSSTYCCLNSKVAWCKFLPKHALYYLRLALACACSEG